MPGEDATINLAIKAKMVSSGRRAYGKRKGRGLWEKEGEGLKGRGGAKENRKGFVGRGGHLILLTLYKPEARVSCSFLPTISH